jgi:general secretion pathway protein G
MKKQKKKIRGFTLVELLLVIVLISVLAAMIIPRFAGRSEKAKRSAAEADLNANLTIALDLYEMDNGNYPVTEQGLQALQSKPEIPPLPRSWQGPYIRKSNLLADPWSNPYKYISPGRHNPESYDLFSIGPDGIEDTSDDITNWINENKN